MPKNALEIGTPTPPDVNSLNSQNSSAQTPPTMAPLQSALVGNQGAAPPTQAQTPVPNHQQTVAALKHFSTIEKVIGKLLQDPDTGKTDMHSKIVDAATKLVSDGMTTPAEAVSMLGTLPERPYEQKKWLEQHFMQTIQAAAAVLDHHRAAFIGHPPQETPDGDHLAAMTSLTNHYQGLKNG